MKSWPRRHGKVFEHFRPQVFRIPALLTVFLLLSNGCGGNGSSVVDSGPDDNPDANTPDADTPDAGEDAGEEVTASCGFDVVYAPNNWWTDVLTKDDGSIYAVGSGGDIVRYDGTSWSPIFEGDQGVRLQAIWSSESNDVFVAGWRWDIVDQPVLLKYDGDGWDEIDPPIPGRAYDICGLDAQNLWAVITDFDTTPNPESTLVYWDGSSWESQHTFVGGLVDRIWCSDWNDIYGLSRARLWHFDGADWSSWSMDEFGWEPGDAATVWGASFDEVYLAGAQGKVFRFDGSDWIEHVTGVSSELYALSGNEAGDLYAGGRDGTLLKYDGTGWAQIDAPTTATIHAVSGAAEDIPVSVCDEGGIFIADETGHTDQTDLAVAEPYSIHAIDEDRFIVSAEHGWLITGEVISASPLQRFDKSTLGTVDGLPSGEKWAGGFGFIVKTDGSDWIDAGPVHPNLQVKSLLPFPGGPVVAAGIIYGTENAWGKVLLNEDEDWEQVWSGEMVFLRDCWGLSEEEYWCVGGLNYWNEEGIIVHYDGSGFEEILLSIPTLNGIAGRENGEVVVVGEFGTIWSYDGSDWSEEESGTKMELNSVVYSDDGEFFLAGGDNTLLIREEGVCSEVSYSMDYQGVAIGSDVNFSALSGDPDGVFYSVGHVGDLHSRVVLRGTCDWSED